MKKTLFLLLMLFATSCFAQEKCDTTAFRVVVNSMSPRRFPMRMLSSGYELEVRNDSAIVHLPYMGEVHMPAFNDDGLNFSEPIKEMKVKTNRKGTARIITFKVSHSMISYHFIVTAFDGGSGDIDVEPSNGDSCSYYGDWENTQNQANKTDTE